MKDLAQSASDAVKNGQVKFHPENFAKTYLDWLNNIRDWTISRQIWWGHRLPVWQCQTGSLKSKIESQKSKTEEDFVVANEQPQTCPSCKNCLMMQSADVLDTWFSSALWPFATLGWPQNTRQETRDKRQDSDLDKFYPTALITNDRGIINLWDARMIFSGLEFMGQVPFKDILVHATVLTKDGQRMSKSLGTGIDPLELIEQHGADAVRFALMWQTMGAQDIRWQQEAVVAGKKFLNKIWNAARFVLQNATYNLQLTTYNPENLAAKINTQIVNEFQKIKEQVSDYIDNYEFGQALHTLYDFFWHEFCDRYIEETKKLNDNETSQTLLYVLAESLKLLHPFIPFITEALWGKIPLADKKLLMVEKW